MKQIIINILLGIFYFLVITEAFDLLSQPSDVAVGYGISIVVFLVVLTIYIFKKRKIK